MTVARPGRTTKAASLFLEAERREERGDLKGAFERLLAASRLGHSMS